MFDGARAISYSLEHVYKADYKREESFVETKNLRDCT